MMKTIADNSFASLTIPNTDGSIVVDNSLIASPSIQSVVGRTSSPFVYQSSDRVWTVDGTLPQQHSTSIPIDDYNVLAKNKVYKIIKSLMNFYRKNKKDYKINFDNYYRIGGNFLTIKPTGAIQIDIISEKDNDPIKTEPIPQIIDSILNDCVVKFLNSHAEEFMELVESEVKADLIKSAKEKKDYMKDELDLIGDIIKMED